MAASNPHDLQNEAQLSSSMASPAALAPGRKVNRSCLECTRRKVKCDGRQPCASCVYYRSAEACAYRQRSKRNAVSRRYVFPCRCPCLVSPFHTSTYPAAES